MEKITEKINNILLKYKIYNQIYNISVNELIITKEKIKKFVYYNNIDEYKNDQEFMLYQFLCRLLDIINTRIENI